MKHLKLNTKTKDKFLVRAVIIYLVYYVHKVYINNDTNNLPFIAAKQIVGKPAVTGGVITGEPINALQSIQTEGH